MSLDAPKSIIQGAYIKKLDRALGVLPDCTKELLRIPDEGLDFSSLMRRSICCLLKRVVLVNELCGYLYH